jgi:glyoxylase-like metal-dependent hydrolase (beta-lactamase superfamily II)
MRVPDAGADTAGLPAAPELLQMEVGLLQNFCEILSCPDSGEAAIVDPAWEVDRLLEQVRRRGLRLTKVLVTHGHNDHVEGLGALLEHVDATIVVDVREAAHVRAALGGARAHIDFCSDRQDIAIGRRGVRALSTPGHTVGGTCFLGDGYVITGDVLFVGSCGRTDFPGGDVASMWRSLQRLGALPEETRVYPGHDYGSTPVSSIGRELLENRFLRCATLDEFRALRAPPPKG